MKIRKYVAGTTTINLIRDICRKGNPKRVLEFGGGSGALTNEVLTNSDAHIDTYEPLAEFQEVLKNRFGIIDRLTVCTSYLQLPPERDYDLLIVDGGKHEDEQAFRKMVACHLLSLNSVKKVVVEGQRKSQRYWIVEILKMGYLYKPTLHKDMADGKSALEITCKKSNSSLLKLLNHQYYRKKIYK